jgi:hypothetical protein
MSEFWISDNIFDQLKWSSLFKLDYFTFSEKVQKAIEKANQATL